MRLFSTLNLSLIALALIAFVGTANAQDVPVPTMDPTTSVPTVTASEALLMGQWAADIQALMAEEMAGLSAEEAQMAQAMLAGMAMTLTFTDDHNYTMVASWLGETETEAGTWAVTTTAANTMVLMTTDTEGTTSPITVVFNTDSNMTATAEGEAIVFNRVVAP